MNRQHIFQTHAEFKAACGRVPNKPKKPSDIIIQSPLWANMVTDLTRLSVKDDKFVVEAHFTVPGFDHFIYKAIDPLTLDSMSYIYTKDLEPGELDPQWTVEVVHSAGAEKWTGTYRRAQWSARQWLRAQDSSIKNYKRIKDDEARLITIVATTLKVKERRLINISASGR